MSKKLQGKAKANARKKASLKKANQNRPNVDFKPNQYKLPIVGGFVSMTADVELKKMINAVTSDIIPHNTKSNQADINAINFGDEAGFMVALVPRNTVGLMTQSSNETEIRKVMSDFTVRPLDDQWAIFSTYCTKDRVFGHMTDLEVFHYAFIGFSTPKCVAPLAEDRDLCIALRDGSDPFSKKKMVA